MSDAADDSVRNAAKGGEPVAKCVPATESSPLDGSVRFKVSDEKLIEPLPERWHAAQP